MNISLNDEPRKIPAWAQQQNPKPETTVIKYTKEDGTVVVGFIRPPKRKK